MKFFSPFKQTWSAWWRRSKLFRYLSLFGAFAAAALLIILPALSQPVTLRILMLAPDVASFKDTLVKEFEQQNPGIRVEILEGPNAANAVEDLYSSAFLLGNSPYDLINMDVVWTPKFAAAGWLMDLTGQVPQQELTGFSQNDLESGRYQDKLYRLPTRSDAGVLYYRKDLLEAAGLEPPKTFEDIVTISKTLQDKNAARWGYVWQGRQYEGLATVFVEALKGFGGYWVNPDTLEVGLDKPEAIRAAEFLRSTITEGISPPGVTTYIEEDTRRIFQAGEAVFLRNWPYVWPLANADDSPLKGKVGIMPMVPAVGRTDGGSCLGGWGLGIAKTTRHPKEALQAIRFMTSQEPQKRFITEAGFVPSRRSLFTDPDVTAKYSHYPQLLEISDNAVLRPSIAQYAQASDILQRYLSAALTNQRSPEQAMQAAAQETRRLLEAGKAAKRA
ncbi:ABC transporter substrate-binding protein [Leptolyngbya sp. FACHB-36]|uniref:ABC transporter substrate-binding protein n=1 Tax=Leptolyngbya sp. FACHB-36 TaxID=2692808 RepID=UPI001680A311|nr:ABC transporter substrate-binding protein [Leptolyngbya sp. FACHB-36]MBD2020145.1 ABC transporter substrate-binding protein [Leptolyngbya sp. FACHB-36]